MNTNTRKRRISGPKAYAALFAASLVLGLAGGSALAAMDKLQGVGGVLAAIGLLLGLAGVVTVMNVWWWRGLDEAAREAHKWAWWWGGSTGLGVGGAMLLALLFRGEALIPTHLIGETPAEHVVAGMFAVMVCQIAGYGLAWAAWWLQRR